LKDTGADAVILWGGEGELSEPKAQVSILMKIVLYDHSGCFLTLGGGETTNARGEEDRGEKGEGKKIEEYIYE